VLQANTELKAANQNVAQANEELQAANRRERQRFDLAMDAIKLFHGEISKDLLLKQRQFQQLRGRLLLGAADFYGRLQELLKDREDRDSRAALGRAYDKLGELTIDIGNFKNALAVYQQAIDVRRRLARESADDERTRLDLARNLQSAGFLLEGMSEQRQAMALYEESLAIAKALKPVEGMTEPPYLVESKALYSIGWLNHTMGKEEEAAKLLRQSAEINEKGIAATAGRAGPDKDSYLFLVSTLNSLTGPLAGVAKWTESLDHENRALEFSRKLIDAYPQDPWVQISYGSTFFNLGVTYRSLSRNSQAFAAFRAGLDIMDKLVAEYPAIVEYRRFHARCLNGCGGAAHELGRPDEALAYFDRARSEWQFVVDSNPDRASEPVELATTYNRIGYVFFGTGKTAEALREFESARAILQRTVDRFPPKVLPRTRSELSNILINIAEVQRRQGRPAEARAACDRAIAIREAVVKEFPEVMSYGVKMGECLMRLGQVKLAAGDMSGAVVDWQRAIASYESLPRYGGEYAMFEAGCHALLSSVAGLTGSGVSAADGRVEVEKAMAILRRAVDEGSHAPELKNESCLEPLRTRRDFQILMMDVDFPAEPFAPSD
jgi:tetratricopeptide (TPR) repeat protein